MKKTILFLANGFGIESKKSNYETGEIVPTIIKLNNDYLSTTLLSSGKEVCFSSSVSADYQTGYRAFSTAGKITTAEKLLDIAITNKNFINEKLSESINFAKSNNSKLHILFSIGNKISYTSIEHLKEYILEANRQEVKEICVHLLLGINSDPSVFYAKDIIKVMNRILEPCKNWSIVSGVGIKNIDDSAAVEELAKYYRINTTTVAEVWADPTELLNQRYKNSISDENVSAFLTKRRLIYEDNDSFFIFNYEYLEIERYLSILTYPDKVFSHGFLAKNLKITSLFPIKSNTKIAYAYQYALPEFYFSKTLEAYNKKITFITTDVRYHFISEILNGYREKSPLIEFKLLKVQQNSFAELTKFALSEIANGENELIIIDYDACINYKQNEVATLIENFKNLDKAVADISADSLARKNTLIITSLYGVKEEIQVEHVKYSLNFSEKVPFIMVDHFKSKNTAYISGTTINDILETVLNHLSVPGFKSFIVTRKKGGKHKANLVYLILILLIVFMLIYSFLI